MLVSNNFVHNFSNNITSGTWSQSLQPIDIFVHEVRSCSQAFNEVLVETSPTNRVSSNLLQTTRMFGEWERYKRNRISKVAVLSHCFTDYTCVRKSAFFVYKNLVARATSHKTIALITNSIKICIIYHLCAARFHVGYKSGN